MKFNESLASVIKDPTEAIEKIVDNMIKYRPEEDVVYRPYRKNEIYSDLPIVGPRKIDLKKLYPQAKKGNVVYVSTILESCSDSEAKINFEGNARVFFCGEMIFDTQNECCQGNSHSCKINLRKGENPIIFMVRCVSDENFEFQFMPSVKYYRMWAKYYLLHVRATSPIKEYAHEDGVGISKLYETEQEFDGEYVFPTVEKNHNLIDFYKIFPNESGVCAYAVTYARYNTTLKIKTDCLYKVLVNGKTYDNNIITLQKNDCVVVKVIKGSSWSFEFEGDIYIPFLKSSRGGGDKWLTIGTYGKDDCLKQKFAPEYEIQFTRPYTDYNGNKIFWKLSGKNDYIRPYLDTYFFGQWFYALMVGNFGLLKAAEVLDNEKYKDYFVKSTKIMAMYFEYMRYERDFFGQSTFLELGTALYDLDSVGTIGTNMCELYNYLPDSDVLYCIEILEKTAKENIPRFEDGTYCRQKDMWADDMYMSCPFLVRLAKIKGERSYYEEAVRQIMGFKKRLWMEEEKIFSHIYFIDTQVPNNIPWGRGNGWIFMALSDALENIPQDVKGYNEIMKLYQEFAEGISALQDKSGLWHQVMNREDSYQETSCSGMFMLGMCRGVLNGWLNDSYIKNIIKAYNAIISEKISADGNIFDVCMGSSNSMHVEYYLNLGTVDNDDHGTGVILAAISEMIKLYKSKKML